jgi:hypothetical protein
MRVDRRMIGIGLLPVTRYLSHPFQVGPMVVCEQAPIDQLASPNHVSPMPRHVPIELYALIFQHITSNAALSNLCMVSRTFRREAQRMLYHTIRLSTDCYCIMSWCHVIVENPDLAVQVHALHLPIAFAQRPGLTAERLELRHAVKRALSSLSRLVELQTYWSSGTLYVNSNMFCGHPFHLQVFGETLHFPGTLKYWLKFLSEQPGIRHWKSNIHRGPSIDPDILPLLTSAQICSPELYILAPCRMIRALRVSIGAYEELPRLKTFRHSLTSLCLEDVILDVMRLNIVRDAVPNIKFLGLELGIKVSLLVQSLSRLY